MSKRAWGRNNYTEEEIEALVEGYAELVYKKHRPSILVRLADLEKALRRVPKRERDALVMTGIVGLNNEDAGYLLGVSESAVRKRARRALETVYVLLNGSDS